MISISPLEVLCLKKLVLVNHALGTMLSGEAAREQKVLTTTLNDITLRADLDNHTPPKGAAPSLPNNDPKSPGDA